MKAIVLTQYGTPEDLQLQEVEAPKPNANQVLIKVYAAAVNFLDIGKATGAFKDQFQLSFPWIPGIDFSGIVAATGDQVKDFKVGDEVYGLNLDGGAFASYVAVSTDLISHKPHSLNFIEAASVPVSAETAWQALFQHGQILKGKTVLIHGGAGAVGSYAVQLASQAGATVIVTADLADVPYLKLLGADQIIDKNEVFENLVNNIDLVLDLVGKDVQQRSYQVIKEGGYLVATNQPPSAEQASKFKINALFFQLKPSGAGLSVISSLLDTGKLKIGLAAVYPLEEVVTAWNGMLGKLPNMKKNGRIVLEITK